MNKGFPCFTTRATRITNNFAQIQYLRGLSNWLNSYEPV